MKKDWTIEIQEKIYDDNISKYQYTIDNPMAYVGKYKNGYRIQCDSVVETAKTCTEICEKALKILISENINAKLTYIDVTLHKNYDDLFVSYIWNDVEFFDIQHVLYHLKLKNIHEKIKSLSNDVKYFTAHKNEHNGYIIRHFIDINTIKKIVNCSRRIAQSDISKALNIEIYGICTLSKEIDCLSKISKIFNGIEMISQYSCGTYRIDMFMPTYKIAIECDEYNHAKRDAQYERNRELYIIDKLNCKFIRFNPDDKDFDIDNVCNKIVIGIINSGKILQIAIELEDLKSRRAIELEKEKNRGLEIQKEIIVGKEREIARRKIEISRREIEIANRRIETDVIISNNKRNANIKTKKQYDFDTDNEDDD